jgi:hypothetical protein
MKRNRHRDLIADELNKYTPCYEKKKGDYIMVRRAEVAHLLWRFGYGLDYRGDLGSISGGS